MADTSRRDFLKLTAAAPAMRFVRLEADGSVHDSGMMSRDEVLDYLTSENAKFTHIFRQYKASRDVEEPEYLTRMVEDGLRRQAGAIVRSTD